LILSHGVDTAVCSVLEPDGKPVDVLHGFSKGCVDTLVDDLCELLSGLLVGKIWQEALMHL